MVKAIESCYGRYYYQLIEVIGKSDTKHVVNVDDDSEDIQDETRKVSREVRKISFYQRYYYGYSTTKANTNDEERALTSSPRA